MAHCALVTVPVLPHRSRPPDARSLRDARSDCLPAPEMSSLPSGHGPRSAPTPMSGWVIPPPRQSVKSDEDLRREREAKIAELGRRGLLRSERLRRAMLIVRREDFIPSAYRDHA